MNAMIGRNLLKFRKRFRQNQETPAPREEMSMERSDINLNQINVSRKFSCFADRASQYIYVSN
jgi:hypothetical protein